MENVPILTKDDVLEIKGNISSIYFKIRGIELAIGKIFIFEKEISKAFENIEKLLELLAEQKIGEENK